MAGAWYDDTEWDDTQETIAVRMPGENQGVATAFGMSDDGLTGVFPVDTRKYDER